MSRQIFFIFRTYLDMIIDLIYSFFWEGKRKAIPDLEKRHSILMESAVSLAAKIRNKELKSEDLVNACIERIQSVNPIINAVTDERFEEALKEAREVDQMIATGLSDEEFKKKPFLGVPFTAKECHAMKGMLQTLGIKARAHVRAHEDARCVRLMRAAGAIALAVTNVPEINKWAETRNLVFGQTNNPYHTGRTVGGSSGGEAALMAAIASPISLCSDIGGSTRMPAFYCGLFGLNPTAGYTSLEGSTLRSGKDDTMASIGFVSRHCSDLGPLTNILFEEKSDEMKIDRIVDLKSIKYYYVETSQDLRMSPICPDLRKAMNQVITNLTEEAPSSGAPKRYYHEGFNYTFALWRYWMTRETENFARMLTNNTGEANFFIEIAKKVVGLSNYTFAAIFKLFVDQVMPKVNQEWAEKLTKDLKEDILVVGLSNYTFAGILKLFDDQVMPKVNQEWAEKLTKDLKEDILSTLGNDGVLLFPSAPAPAPYHHSLILRPFNFGYWAILNVLRCPAAQVPLGLNAEGLPLGIQVVAAPKNEALCLAVAKHLGKAFGGFVPPCRVLD